MNYTSLKKKKKNNSDRKTDLKEEVIHTYFETYFVRVSRDQKVYYEQKNLKV